MSKIQGLLFYSGTISIISLVLDLFQMGEMSLQILARAVVFTICGAIGWSLGQRSSGKVLPKKTIILNAAFVFFFANSAVRLLSNPAFMFIVSVSIYVFVSWLIAKKLPAMVEQAEANNQINQGQG